MKTLKLIAATVIITLIGSRMVWSDPALSSDPETAWGQVQQAAQKAAQGPASLDAWKTRQPTREEREQWYKQQGDMSATAAAEAKMFYTQFPDSPHALAAKKLECQMLGTAFREGGQNQSAYTA